MISFAVPRGGSRHSSVSNNLPFVVLFRGGRLLEAGYQILKVRNLNLQLSHFIGRHMPYNWCWLVGQTFEKLSRPWKLEFSIQSESRRLLEAAHLHFRKRDNRKIGGATTVWIFRGAIDNFDPRIAVLILKRLSHQSRSWLRCGHFWIFNCRKIAPHDVIWSWSGRKRKKAVCYHPGSEIGVSLKPFGLLLLT